MSGSYKNRDGFIYFPHELNKYEETMFQMQFDTQCDFDVADIKLEIEENNFLRKVCLYKVLLSGFELFFTLCMFGFRAAKAKIKETGLYWSFFRKKISLGKFKKELTALANSGKLV